MQRLELDEPVTKRRRIEKLVRGDEKGEDGGKGPRIEETDGTDAKDLTDRLRSFLPQLEAANTLLDTKTTNIEDVNEDEDYIEMNLGLGVLEEKRDSDEDSDDEDEDENLDTDEEGNVFDKLLRRTRDPGRKALVESVDPGGKGGVRLMDSSEDSDDSTDEESDDQEEQEDNEPPLKESSVKKRGKDARTKIG